MHDCLEMENKLVDLVFDDELGGDAKLRLLAEVESCKSCLNEYRSMTGTLNIFDRAAEAAQPGETYWPAHRAALRRGLEEEPAAAADIASAKITVRRDPLWKRIFAARLPVPAPLAAAAVLALFVSSALALRPSTGKTTIEIQPVVSATTTTAQAAAPQPRVIEVPVVHERVVTRTVYVERKERRDARPSVPNMGREDESLTARTNGRESVQGGFFTRANLTDFQPPDEMKIRVIKRSNEDED